MTRHVWYDLNENKRDIVCETLEKYCVPYRQTVHSEYSVWSGSHSYTYDISADLSPEIKSNGISPRDFIIKKVEESLSNHQFLEDMYKRTSACEPRSMVKDVMSAPTKCDVSSTVDKAAQKTNLIEQIKQLSDKLFKDKKTEKKPLKNPTEKDLDKFFNEVLPIALLGSIFPTLPDMNNAKRFDELDAKLQKKLLETYSKEELRADNCKIYVNNTGFTTTVAVVMEEEK